MCKSSCGVTHDVFAAFAHPFRAKINNFTIVGYDTGNIVINSDELKPLVNEILYEMRKHKLNFDISIGSDETGKGEWLGPLTIAAVALNPSQLLYLQGEGVKDSKELNISNIDKLSNIIKNNSIDYSIIPIYPIEFNYLFNKYKEEGKNLNDILADSHYKAINTIIKTIINIIITPTIIPAKKISPSQINSPENNK